MEPHPVDIERELSGPFERISLTRRDPQLPRPPQLSVYRIGDTLIDTGSTRTAEALVRALADRPPRRILCTHQHEDHVGGVTALREAFGELPVFVPRPHVSLLTDFDRVPDYRAAVWGDPIPITDAIAYDVGDGFEAAGVHLDTVASAGHTAGHVAFIARDGERAYALTGDLYTSSPFVAWYESSAPCLLSSCRSIAALARELVMLPTHGRVREDGGTALLDLAEKVEPMCERVERSASELGVGPGATASELWRVATAVLGPDDGRALMTHGEWSHACFVRSVLDPVLELPVAGIPLPAA